MAIHVRRAKSVHNDTTYLYVIPTIYGSYWNVYIPNRQLLKACMPHSNTSLMQTHVLEWYMARLVVIP